MIERNLSKVLIESSKYYPVVTVTGPRQSGKTTLCKSVFPHKRYLSLENIDAQTYARQDPRGFLEEYSEGAVFDEIQHVPDLLSYLQTEVDERPDPGRFVLTGSQHFGFSASISQSLAGRTAVLELMPVGIDELNRFPEHPKGLLETIWKGGYPRIHDRHIPADRFLADYLTTYIQRDVRQVLNVGNLVAFNTFVRLCAGRTAGICNLSSLSADSGINHNTAKAWLSVLEAGYIVFRLPAWYRNIKKQLIKAPKIHFLDSGLACYLLDIGSPEQLRHHPLRGAIFESWVLSEVYKTRVHRGKKPNLYYFRDRKGLEVDLVLDEGDTLIISEIKSGKTMASDFLTPLNRLTALIVKSEQSRTLERRLIFGGDENQKRSDTTVISWSKLADCDW